MKIIDRMHKYWYILVIMLKYRGIHRYAKVSENNLVPYSYFGVTVTWNCEHGTNAPHFPTFCVAMENIVLDTTQKFRKRKFRKRKSLFFS